MQIVHFRGASRRQRSQVPTLSKCQAKTVSVSKWQIGNIKGQFDQYNKERAILSTNRLWVSFYDRTGFYNRQQQLGRIPSMSM